MHCLGPELNVTVVMIWYLLLTKSNVSFWDKPTVVLTLIPQRLFEAFHHPQAHAMRSSEQ